MRIFLFDRWKVFFLVCLYLDVGDGGFQLFLSSLEGSFLSSGLSFGLTSDLSLTFGLGKGLGDFVEQTLSLGDFGAVVSLGVDEGLPVHVVAEQQVVSDGEQLGSLVLSDGASLAKGVSQSDDGESLSEAFQEAMSIQLVQTGSGGAVLQVEVSELQDVAPETLRLVLLLIPKGIQEPDGLLLVVASAKRQKLLVVGLSFQCHYTLSLYIQKFTCIRTTSSHQKQNQKETKKKKKKKQLKEEEEEEEEERENRRVGESPSYWRYVRDISQVTAFSQ